MVSNLTEEDFKEYMNQLEIKQKSENPYFLILSEIQYDDYYNRFGENCGWDINMVKVYRGFPTFNILKDE